MANEKSGIKFNQEGIIYHPQYGKSYAISETDINRLKKNIRRIKTQSRLWQSAGAWFFGVVTSAAFTILTVYMTDHNFPAWVMPTLFSVAISSMAIAIFCFYFDHLQGENSQETIEDTIQEIDEIIARCQIPVKKK